MVLSLVTSFSSNDDMVEVAIQKYNILCTCVVCDVIMNKLLLLISLCDVNDIMHMLS